MRTKQEIFVLCSILYNLCSILCKREDFMFCIYCYREKFPQEIFRFMIKNPAVLEKIAIHSDKEECT